MKSETKLTRHPETGLDDKEVLEEIDNR